MTDISAIPVSLDDERLIREGETAAKEYNKSANRMRTEILIMARGLLAAKRRYPATQDFGRWLSQSPYSDVGDTDRAALIKIGEHERLFAKFIRTTTLVSPELIWEEYHDVIIALSSSDDRKSTSEPTKIPDPPVSVALDPEPRQPVAPNPEKPKAGIAKPSPVLYDAPEKSKLRDVLKPAVAEILLTRFKNTRMFVLLCSNNPKKECVTLLNHLAERCQQPDYPNELFLTASWTLRLLYPYLPQKLLDMTAKSLRTMAKTQHASLVETERRFVLTPEFGVTDPPLTAFNKAQSIYNAIIHVKNGGTFDQSTVHRPVYAGDEGKPPVVVRGTQLWPTEEGAGYGYDDLRCACGLADDVLCTFGEPRDAPMTTRSLKLRHLLSWLPGGYNSVGTTKDGVLKALRDVVHAYSVDKNDVMRNPLPSMKKLDEA